MENVNLVLLMGGKATRLEPINYFLPKGLNIINSKPAVFNNIQQMIKRGLKEITIVCNDTNYYFIKQCFEMVYSKILKINIVIQKDLNGPLGAMQCTKDYINKPTLLMLGDTLCDCDFNLEKSFVGYSLNKNENDFRRWCFLEDDQQGKITCFVDKPSTKPNTKKIVMGVYFFKNYELLKRLLTKEYKFLHGEKQLSSLLANYMKYEPMFSQEINNWKDIGSLKDYANVNIGLLSGRYFNDFKFKGHTIIKEGGAPVIKHEIEWYKQIIETPLKIYIPHIIDYKIEEDFYSYEMEYLNGHSLHVYNTFFPIPFSNWEYILTNLIQTASAFWDYKDIKLNLDSQKAGINIYIEKTQKRIKEWDNELSEYEYVILNGQKMYGFNSVMKKLNNKLEKLISKCSDNLCVIHGDLNFSNIFYYPEINGFKFIDPRGNFMDEGVGGDKRYDVAKMRHSFVYNHNKLVQGFFALNQINENNFDLDYDYSEEKEQLFNDVVEKQGFCSEEIKIIDGLLFLSQIPLHKEDKEFQISSYLLGLKMLNECI